MRRRFDLFVTALLIPLDLIALLGAALTAYTLRFSRAFVERTAGVMILIATVFFQRELTTSRFIVVAVWVLSIAFVWVERLVIRVARHALLRAKIGHRRVLVGCRGKHADELVELYKRLPILGFTVTRHFSGWDDRG